MSDPESNRSNPAFEFSPDGVEIVMVDLLDMFGSYRVKLERHRSILGTRNSDFSTGMYAAKASDDARNSIKGVTEVMDKIIPREDQRTWFEYVEITYDQIAIEQTIAAAAIVLTESQ